MIVTNRNPSFDDRSYDIRDKNEPLPCILVSQEGGVGVLTSSDTWAFNSYVYHLATELEESNKASCFR